MDLNVNLIRENIRIAFISIKSHLMRTTLTILIIAFGIMALVGILTAIDAVEYSLSENFAMMGSNTFNIQNRGLRVHIGGKRTNPVSYREIKFKEAMDFKEQYKFPAAVSVFTRGTGIATLKYKTEKTNPNISVLGADENYIVTSGLEIAKGRNFSDNELHYGNHVVIIGDAIAKDLFKKNVDPLGKVISIGAGKYRIIGVLKERGSSIGFSGDRSCLVPITNVRQYFSSPNMNYIIRVMVNDPMMMQPAISEATGLFRKIRKDRLGNEDSFSIVKSDNIANMLIDLTGNLQIGATIIGLITLRGAAIGLMNIMLVSVTDRTREIGIRKAVGAKRHTIRNQFLAEAIVIAQAGGILGIVAGILMGNVVSYFTGSNFIIPWVWVILGVVLCFIVALLSGIIPAMKAAKLDPVESLRYE
jgi:putative ABC transport system permease protein